jgi:hypothetical protein
VRTGASGAVGAKGAINVRSRSCSSVLVLILVMVGCSRDDPAPPPSSALQAPKDAQHAGITEPHGDHSPHHGGVVLMNGDVHYEVVMDPAGKYEVWFSDAVRTDLPASVAANARVEVTRPGSGVESLPLAIDEAGESWVGTGRPVTGDGVMVKVTYALKGIPSEVELPFVPPTR